MITACQLRNVQLNSSQRCIVTQKELTVRLGLRKTKGKAVYFQLCPRHCGYGEMKQYK